jgi:myosin-5
MIQDHLHRPYEFGIRHYAAPITYDARQFIEKNLDRIPPDLLKSACKSTNPLLREEFLRLSTVLEAPSKSGGLKMRSETTKHLVFSKFKHQLTSLMSLIEKSRTRYIRCVKPNKEMNPKIMDHSHTVAQLESAGLVTAIVISRESFPNRLPYELVMKRFRFLEYKFLDCHLNSGDIKVDAENLLNYLFAGRTVDSHQGKVKVFACGKSRVYFRAGALEFIETTRQDYYAQRAVQLQAWMRSLLLRQRFVTLKRGMIRLQSFVRCWLARTTFARSVQSVVTMQCFTRKCLARKELTRLREENASTIIQTR